MHFLVVKLQHSIQLNARYANYVEQILEGNSTAESKEVAFTRFYITLLHEAAHDLNKLGKFAKVLENGNDSYSPLHPKNRIDGEMGYKAEEATWGTPSYKPFSIPDPEYKLGVEGLSPENYQPGVTEGVINEAKKTEEGRKSLPTIPSR